MASSLTNFNKELSRFALKYKAELLEEVKTVVDSGEDLKTYLENALATVETDLASLDKKAKSKRNVGSAPRPLSAYNKFIKVTLPELKAQNPDMDNKTRMSKASEKWQSLTPKQKESYKTMEV
jgi:hypothetical protein|uniref:HMG box domain-containing protein n=1 Tax=viral metagenome TaxID=1070528 RepID=A0A6C0CUF1_9ZZZZ